MNLVICARAGGCNNSLKCLGYPLGSTLIYLDYSRWLSLVGVLPKGHAKTHVRGGGNQPLERLEEVGKCMKRYASPLGSFISRLVTDTHTSVSHTKS